MKSDMSREELNRWIGELVRQKRTTHNHSQEVLSELVGLSPNFIYKLENGKKAASIHSYYRIACAFHMSLAELFEDSNESNGVEKMARLLCDWTQEQIQVTVEILRAIQTQFV